MSVDLFYSTYAHFTDPALQAIRSETFLPDIGQNSWLTVDEYYHLLAWLGLTSESRVLEVASGAGGPVLFLAQTVGCTVNGVDINEDAVATAQAMAKQMKLDARAHFQTADANQRLPFEDNQFDALLCIDSVNHFADRLGVLREWKRVLKPGGTVLYLDPVIISGAVSNEELAARSSIGFFLFMPPGVNERLIAEAGLTLVRQEDRTGNAALVAKRWHDARAKYSEDLLIVEGRKRYEALQHFFMMVHTLTVERRLTRVAFMARK